MTSRPLILLLSITFAARAWSVLPSPRATRSPIEILGIDPSRADVGDTVRIRLSSKPSDTYSVLVGNIPVTTTSNSADPLWITFTIPTTVPPDENVTVKLIDGSGSSSAPLRIYPIRILSVDPTVAVSGQQISLTIHPSDVSLISPELIFDSQSSSPSNSNISQRLTSSLQVLSPGKLSATVPQNVPAGSVSLVLLTNGHSSPPFSVLVRRVFPWWNFAVGTLGVVAGLLVILNVWRNKQSRATSTKPISTPLEATLDVPFLEVPDDLVESCRRNQCVLYVGAGLSARAGLPTWRIFVQGLLKWAEAESLIEASFSRALEQALDRGGADRVADSVVNAVIERNALESLHKQLDEIFGKALTLPDVHRVLADINFAAALTTNFDKLIEQTFRVRGPDVPVYVPSDVDGLRSSFSLREFFVLKLYGALQRPESLLVAPTQYLDRIRADQPFTDFVQQVFHSRTLLFLGSSFAGIEAYLAPLKIRVGSQIRHYALVGVDDAGWRADADSLERRYGIRVLPYVVSARHGEVLTFVKDLRERLAVKDIRPANNDMSQDAEQAAVVLKHLELRNVGPFEYLELSFSRRWTILLGDNGVGKSSVLRAIAAVVAGEQTGAGGVRLLRSGQSEGHIQVTTINDEPYAVRLFLNSLKRPEIASEGASGLGGSLLVLAFPAIRTMAAGPTRGPELRELRRPPTADDVLPALEALPDPRILGFKQWLTNLDYIKTKSPELAKRVDVVMDALTSTIGILLGGMRIERIEVLEKDVFVQTDDGQLSLDTLSQGTVSILGWVGVLVQRLHEVSDAADGRALVLVDEIDAHMHPEWQQAIISRLVEAFPHVQFIVSTHSPFLAVGRRAEEIIRFRRDIVTRRVIAEPADRDTTDMTVADVLTSYLFGLETAVDHGLQKDILRLRELSLRQNLSREELDDLRRLQTKLDGVGVADTQADPLYGRFVEELTKQQAAKIASLPPLSKKAEERQRELTKQIAHQVLGTVASSDEKRTP